MAPQQTWPSPPQGWQVALMSQAKPALQTSPVQQA
jgi:hypothetical protein